MVLDPPAYFGKSPARGDFLMRRMAPALATTWDRWLGTFTTSVREAAGAEWPDVWLTAPLWRFALGARLVPGVGGAGVMIASVDRVGRMFPFTIIGGADGLPDSVWFDAVEALALSSLDDGFDPDALDAALVALGPPAAGEPVGSDESVWYTRGSDRVAPGLLRVSGLPDGAVCRAMVLGDQNAPSSGAT